MPGQDRDSAFMIRAILDLRANAWKDVSAVDDLIAQLVHRHPEERSCSAGAEADAENIGGAKGTNDRRAPDLADQQGPRLNYAVAVKRIAEVKHELE